MRLSKDEQDSLKKLAGSIELAEYVRRKVFEAHTEIDSDWYELIEILGEDFLSKLSFKAGSKTDISKWADFLNKAILGVSQETVKSENPYEGWIFENNPNGEQKPYYSDTFMDNVIVIRKGKEIKVIREGQEGWNHFIK